MSDPIKIMTWFWIQDPPRSGFSAEHVNRWAQMMDAHLTIPHTLACVTDHPEGIDGNVEILPLSEIVPSHLMEMKGPGWGEKEGLPQCYRRLALWHRDAADMFGARRLVSMDLDLIAFANLDSAFDHNLDLRILMGTSSKRPYNGGLIQLIAGSRPQVYETITQEGIDASRKKYVGSDQAWISHVLGWGENKFGPGDGIYAWTPRFLATHAQGGFMLPGDSRLIFFPANPKPWEMAVSHPRIYAIWAGDDGDHLSVLKAAPSPSPRKRLWAYDDPKGWGKTFQKEAKAAGMRSWLFANAQNVADKEVAFVRLDQQGSQRDISKGLVERLNERGIATLPTAQEGQWYDDKISQIEPLAKWMPATWVLKSRESAEAMLEDLSIRKAFPIISKSSEGAGSANVRVLNNEDEAWAEIVTAFGSGIPRKYGRIQKDYVYWQRIVPDNPNDYRVCIVGAYAYGLVRLNKPGTLFASGSGSNYPITLADEREIASMKLAVEIAKAIDTKWMAFDFVFDGDTPLVLEMSSAWTMSAYRECVAYTLALHKTTRTGADSFKIAVELMLAMSNARTQVAA